jgi:hypothetical protein
MNAEQRARVLHLVSELPWADIDDAIRDMELCLRLALEATQELAAAPSQSIATDAALHPHVFSRERDVLKRNGLRSLCSIPKLAPTTRARPPGFALMLASQLCDLG